MEDERDNTDRTDRTDRKTQLDGSSSPVSASPSTPGSAETGDPADEVPVPIVMEPAEIDERAQAVEAVRNAEP
jgi:hypothetical protein